jgi:hypothetical protein
VAGLVAIYSVIARSPGSGRSGYATKRSIFVCVGGKMECFAPLAMTWLMSRDVAALVAQINKKSFCFFFFQKKKVFVSYQFFTPRTS